MSDRNVSLACELFWTVQGQVIHHWKGLDELKHLRYTFWNSAHFFRSYRYFSVFAFSAFLSMFFIWNEIIASVLCWNDIFHLAMFMLWSIFHTFQFLISLVKDILFGSKWTCENPTSLTRLDLKFIWFIQTLALTNLYGPKKFTCQWYITIRHCSLHATNQTNSLKELELACSRIQWDFEPSLLRFIYYV